jgi:branched-subunit amino acid ABC-type transport system permease component
MDIDFVGSLLYQFADNMAFLLLSALGLIIILGVLNIVNLAHGELIMIGAYVTSICYYAGLPLLLCFPVAVISVGVFGAGLERVIVRRFYDNKVGAMVATWGVSLVISQGTFLLLGPSMKPIPLPSWQVSLGIYSFSGYRLILFVAALVVVALLWIYFHKLRAGIFTRATMQDSAMAEAIGINTAVISTLSFAIGAGMAGLTGALYSPTQSLVPLMGTTYTAMAFITVVVGGGAEPIIGALASSALLAAVATPLTAAFGTFIGRVGLLFAALIIIRLMPNGISGRITLARRHRQSLIAEQA